MGGPSLDASQNLRDLKWGLARSPLPPSPCHVIPSPSRQPQNPRTPPTPPKQRAHLRVGQHPHRRLRLPELVVDVDERLNGSGGGGGELHLLVVEGLGKGVALLGQGALGGRGRLGAARGGAGRRRRGRGAGGEGWQAGARVPEGLVLGSRGRSPVPPQLQSRDSPATVQAPSKANPRQSNLVQHAANPVTPSPTQSTAAQPLPPPACACPGAASCRRAP